MNMTAKVVQFSGPNSVSILSIPSSRKILVPCRKKQWGGMQDRDEYPLVRWVKILGAAAAMHQPMVCAYIPTKDVQVTKRFLDYTVSWQSFYAVDRLIDRHARQHMEKIERVRCWRGITGKISRWVRNNPSWRDGLFWTWGTNTIRPGLNAYIEDIAGIIRRGVASYCENRSVRQ